MIINVIINAMVDAMHDAMTDVLMDAMIEMINHVRMNPMIDAKIARWSELIAIGILSRLCLSVASVGVLGC